MSAKHSTMGNFKKRLSLTLGRKKARDDAFGDMKTDSVADRSGKQRFVFMFLLVYRMSLCALWFAALASFGAPPPMLM